MKLTISPAWLRWALIIVSGGLAALAALSLASILLGSGALALFPFVPLLASLLLNGSICISSVQQEGPLKLLLYVSGGLSALSGALALLALLVAPAPLLVAALVKSVSSMGIGVATIWVALSCIHARAAQSAS